MRAPSPADAYEVLCLQAADEGRGSILFGDNLARARTLARPFMVEAEDASFYLEFPLTGDPFLDVTVLYGSLEPGTRIDSEAASGTEELIDWFSGICDKHKEVSFGFELDTSKCPLPAAAIHFQPRANNALVEPFCQVMGEPWRAPLYLDLQKRMPRNWTLSFFGMFRGRPDSPMRVCGYLGGSEIDACAKDPSHVASIFDRVGFTSYDEAMLDQMRHLMEIAPATIDFQFDIWPDGSIGDTFAFDVQFGIEQPEAVRESFASGSPSRVMRLLEDWGIADERWKLGAEAAFARAIPIEVDNGLAPFSFTLMPQWAKVRWKKGVLQPSKLYLMGRTGFLET